MLNFPLSPSSKQKSIWAFLFCISIISISKSQNSNSLPESNKKTIKIKRHHISALIGFGENSINEKYLDISPEYRMYYHNSETECTPVTVRYQYALNKSHRVGVDFINSVNPVMVRAEYNFGWTYSGIAPLTTNSMNGFALNYTGILDVKFFKIAANAGIGGFFQAQTTADPSLFRDWDVHKLATEGYYQFGAQTTNQAMKTFLPIATGSLSIKLGGFEIGTNGQMSLTSPVKNVQFNNQEYSTQGIKMKVNNVFIGYTVSF